MGVLAEFHHHGATVQPDRFTVMTSGGAIRISVPEAAAVLAYETPSANPRLWNHGVAFCLPQAEAGMTSRDVMSEIGADAEPILSDTQGELLFDLGLGLRTADFMVRTRDAQLIGILRAAIGRRWSETPAVNQAIVAASPTRVIVSKLARVEISNPIPPPGGVSPDGPHTHLLPDIMRHHRVHDANIPVPAGMLPCLTLYPQHPARDAEGRERTFEPAAHRAFQALLGTHGDPVYVAAKQGESVHDLRLAHLGTLIARRQRAFAAVA